MKKILLSLLIVFSFQLSFAQNSNEKLSITLKDETLRCFFVNRPDSPYFESETFKQLLDYAQKNMNKAHFKQVGRSFILIIKEVKSMQHCYTTLEKIHIGVFPVQV